MILSLTERYARRHDLGESSSRLSHPERDQADVPANPWSSRSWRGSRTTSPPASCTTGCVEEAPTSGSPPSTARWPSSSEHGAVDTFSHHAGELCYRLCGDVHHHHLVCTSCHRVVELADCDLEPWVKRSAKRHGFTATGHEVEIEVCAQSAAARLRRPGRLAQLGERLPYTQEVAGSIPAPPMRNPAPLRGTMAAVWLPVGCGGFRGTCWFDRSKHRRRGERAGRRPEAGFE